MHATIGAGGPGGAATQFSGRAPATSAVRERRNRRRAVGGIGGTGYSNAGPGGGGGGGYFGGGGGGGGGVVTCPSASPKAAGGGGGGAGASFIFGMDAAQINTATTIDGGGVPQIRIMYTPTDTTAPTIALDTPQDGAVYEPDSTVNASYSCTDDAGGSGVASCTGTVPDGSPIDTSTLGQHTFTVDAEDNAGNPASVTIHYTVAPIADLGIAIHGPKKLAKGKTASFRIDVTNDGPDDASAVVVTDRVPAGMKPLGVGGSKASSSCSAPSGPGTVRCTLSSLHAGTAAVFRVKVKATKPGKRTQKVKVSAGTADPHLANNRAELTTKVLKP